MLEAFKAAFRGVGIAWLHERHLKLHTVGMVSVCCVAAYVEVSRIEWAILLLCFGLVTSLEYANSALERLANRVTSERDPLIRDAKDMAAGAVLVASIAAAGVGLLILAPPVLRLILG
ncbi:MAG: diacylglycerol kinase family protein [Bacteroidota bacterium]